MFWYFVSQSSVFFTFYIIFLFDGPMSGVRAVENKLFSWLRSLFVDAGLE